MKSNSFTGACSKAELKARKPKVTNTKKESKVLAKAGVGAYTVVLVSKQNTIILLPSENLIRTSLHCNIALFSLYAFLLAPLLSLFVILIDFFLFRSIISQLFIMRKRRGVYVCLLAWELRGWPGPGRLFWIFPGCGIERTDKASPLNCGRGTNYKPRSRWQGSGHRV